MRPPCGPRKKPRTAGLCGREVGACDHLSLSCTKIEPEKRPFKRGTLVPTRDPGAVSSASERSRTGQTGASRVGIRRVVGGWQDQRSEVAPPFQCGQLSLRLPVLFLFLCLNSLRLHAMAEGFFHRTEDVEQGPVVLLAVPRRDGRGLRRGEALVAETHILYENREGKRPLKCSTLVPTRGPGAVSVVSERSRTGQTGASRASLRRGVGGWQDQRSEVTLPFQSGQLPLCLPELFLFLCLDPLRLHAVAERFLHRAEGIEQGPVVLLAVLQRDGRGLRRDELLVAEALHTLPYGVLRELHRLADGRVARVALVRDAVLAAHQVAVDRDLSRRQVQREDLIRQREIVFDRVPPGVGVVAVLHAPPPTFRSTQARSLSFGITSREPIRRIGKPRSRMSSYMLELETPSSAAAVSALRKSGSSS